jgi:glycine/D-amino acid oxidase-like deaminating enzyme
MEIADVVIIGGAVMGLSIAYHLLNDGFDGRGRYPGISLEAYGT